MILDGYQADGRPWKKEKAVSNIRYLTGIRTHSSSVIVVDCLIHITRFHNCIPKTCPAHYWNRRLYSPLFTHFTVNGIQKRILECSFTVPMRRNTVAKVTNSKTFSRVIRKWNVGLPKCNEFTWVMAMWLVKVQLGLQMKPKFSLNTPLNQSSDLHLPRQAISIDIQKCVCWVSVCTNHSSLTAVKWWCPEVNTVDLFHTTFKRYLQTDRHQCGIIHVYQSVSPMDQKFFCPSLSLSASFVSLPCFVLLSHHSSLLCSLRDRDKEASNSSNVSLG